MKQQLLFLHRFFINNLKTVAFITLVFCAAFVFVVLYYSELENQEIQKKNYEYPFLTKNVELDGYIVSSYDFKGVARIELKNGLKYSIKNSKNFQYESFLLSCFLMKDDHISKKSDNDSITIFRKGKSYIFVIGKTIGQKNKRTIHKNPCR